MEEFLRSAALPFNELQQSEDRFMDLLFEDVTEVGASLLYAEFPRAWCDMNRDWREVDVEMFHPPLSLEDILLTAKVKAGFGVIPRCVSQGKSIYAHHLHPSEMERRLAASWLPYHEMLSRLLLDMRSQFGYAVLLEVHSMPRLPYARACDVVLGDVHGKSCASALTDLLENLLKIQGYSVRRNVPYSGGYITRHYGRPKENIHAIQLELCRSRYLNPATLEPAKGYEETRENMMRLTKDLSSWITKNELCPVAF